MSDDNDDGALALLLGSTLGILVLVLVVPVVLILLVAVVVVLAAVVGTFVLGVGGGAEAAAPQASFSYAYDDAAGTVEITHSGGDSIDADALEIVVSGDRRGSWSTLGSPGNVAAGDDLTIREVTSGDTVRLIHRSDGEAAVLSTFEVP